MMGETFKKESDEAFSKYAKVGEVIKTDGKGGKDDPLNKFMADFKLNKYMTAPTLVKIYDTNGDGLD